MIKRLSIIAISLGLIVASPAQAAGWSQIKCLLGGLDTPTRDALRADARQAYERPTGAIKYRPTSLAPVRAVAEACRVANNWPESAMPIAIRWTVAHHVADIGADLVRAAGWDSAFAIAQDYESLPEAAKQRALTETEIKRVLARAESRGAIPSAQFRPYAELLIRSMSALYGDRAALQRALGA